jgi:hypothetical protein
MAFVDIHPRYRRLLARQGLVTAEDFLGLDGVVCCGHPDRHVVRVALGKGAKAVPAFLKREHQTRWRDRLANVWAGFGLASRSFREFTWKIPRSAARSRLPWARTTRVGLSSSCAIWRGIKTCASSWQT